MTCSQRAGARRADAAAFSSVAIPTIVLRGWPLVPRRWAPASQACRIGRHHVVRCGNPRVRRKSDWATSVGLAGPPRPCQLPSSSPMPEGLLVLGRHRPPRPQRRSTAPGSTPIARQPGVVAATGPAIAGHANAGGRHWSRERFEPLRLLAAECPDGQEPFSGPEDGIA
jgi:hypothetical protein